MLAGVALVLCAVWVLGLATANTMNGMLHVMIPLALALLFMTFMRQRAMI